MHPEEQARLRRVKEKLDNAKPIALTDEECAVFRGVNAGLLRQNHLEDVMRKISERTGIPLSSGRMAFDEPNKLLLVID